jgi:hypothetical protein
VCLRVSKICKERRSFEPSATIESDRRQSDRR